MDIWNWRKSVFILVLLYLQTASTQDQQSAPVYRYKRDCLNVRMSIILQSNEGSYPVRPDDYDAFDVDCGEPRKLTINLPPRSTTTAEPTTTDTTTTESSTESSTDSTSTESSTDSSTDSTSTESSTDSSTDSTSTESSTDSSTDSTSTESSTDSSTDSTSTESSTDSSTDSTSTESSTESSTDTTTTESSTDTTTTESSTESSTDTTTTESSTESSTDTTTTESSTESSTDTTTTESSTESSTDTTTTESSTESSTDTTTTESSTESSTDTTTTESSTESSTDTTTTESSTESSTDTTTTESSTESSTDTTTTESSTESSTDTTTTESSTESSTDTTTTESSTESSTDTTTTESSTESSTDTTTTESSTESSTDTTTTESSTESSTDTTTTESSTDTTTTESSTESSTDTTTTESSTDTTTTESSTESSTDTTTTESSTDTTTTESSTESSTESTADGEEGSRQNKLQRSRRSLRSPDDYENHITFEIKEVNGSLVVDTINVNWKSKGITGTLSNVNRFASPGKYMCDQPEEVPHEDGWKIIMDKVEFQANVGEVEPPVEITRCGGYQNISTPTLPEPEYSQIDVNDCLSANVAFRIMVKYADENGTERYGAVTVPKDATIEGTCEDVTMKWPAAVNTKSYWHGRANTNNSLYLAIRSDSTNFYIEHMKAMLYLNDDPEFEGALDLGDPPLEIEVNKDIVNVSKDSSYVCSRGKEIQADDGTTIIRMYSQGFATAPNVQKVEVCAEDLNNPQEEEDSSNKTLAIALGTIAGVAVVAGVGGYIMHRRKKSSGNQGLA